MDPITAPFTDCLSQVTLQPPQIPYVSNLTGTWVTASAAMNAAAWARHARQPVRFAAGLSTLAQDPGRILLEVGPGQTLSDFARRHPRTAAEHVVLASLSGARDAELASLLRALGQLWLAGLPVSWCRLYSGEQRQRLPLPTYPFERQPHWVAPPRQAAGTTIAASTDHTPFASQEAHSEPPWQTHAERDKPMSAAPVAATPHLDRRQHILARLKTVAHEVSGVDPDTIDISTTFLAIGVNSLLLIQFSQALQDRLGVDIPFRLLFEELSTLEALSAYIDAQLPPDIFQEGTSKMSGPQLGPAMSPPPSPAWPAAVASLESQSSHRSQSQHEQTPSPLMGEGAFGPCADAVAPEGAKRPLRQHSRAEGRGG
jgi:acyl transferase domain-containing protein